MEKFSRSQSTREGPAGPWMEQPSNMHDLRSYSTSDYHNHNHNHPQNLDYKAEDFKEVKIKKGNNKSRIISASSKSWSFNIDPELQRKKRVAGYKAYGVEGKMKGSLRKSFKWIKDLFF